MRKKFEANVAQDIPKTKLNEPELPWKISNEDLEQIAVKEGEEYKELTQDMPPLKARAAFLIALVAAVFLFILQMISNFIAENDNMRLEMLRKSTMVNSLQSNLQKVATQNLVLSKTQAEMEKKVDDLTAQKTLFTDVIESLTKKGEEIEVEGDMDARSAP